MSANDTRASEEMPTPAEARSAEIAELADELNALTDHIEADWKRAGMISKDDAGRLAELRRRFEQLITE